MNVDFGAKKVAAYLTLLLCTAEMAHGAPGDLVGDSNGNGAVTSSDIGQVKAASRQSLL